MCGLNGGALRIVYSAIGLTEVLGASWSATTMLWVLVHTHLVPIPWSYVVADFAACGIVGFAGLSLLRRREWGDALSVGVQVPQLIQLTAGPFAFRFLAGPQFTVFWSHRLGVFLGLTSGMRLWRLDADPPFAVGVNILALGMILVLTHRLSHPAPGG